MGARMKIYDISQEVLSCQVYPGDPAPVLSPLLRMQDGGLYNLSALSMCVHNGTHVDAPFHFIRDGKTVDQMPVESFVGMAYVHAHAGVVTADDAQLILQKAKAYDNGCEKRILIKGNAEVSLEAAQVLAEEQILLLGNESQTVGPENAPMAVHKTLLSKDMVLLEGVRLSHVPEGAYLLNALPLNLAGADGAPCRAVLMQLDA